MDRFGKSIRLFRLHILLILVSCFSAFTATAAAPGKDCGQELRDGHEAFIVDLRSQGFESGAFSQQHGPAANRLRQWLQARHDEVVRHEKAHAAAAGQWHIEIRYQYYKWWGQRYATSGCELAKPGQPLESMIKTAYAPEQPSSVDMANAERAKQWIAIKEARANCKKTGNMQKRNSCLASYRQYSWLDNYPLR